MARARLIKPGFFANADLARVPAHGRLLFAGLWTIADKAGRLKDDALWIKGQVFPFEDIDCEPLLEALRVGGFVHRYVIGRARYIQIVTWERHQHPHVNEAESCIPESKKHRARTANGESATSNGGTTRAVSKSVSNTVSDPVYGVGSPKPASATAVPTLEPVLPEHSAEPGLTDFEALRNHWKSLIGALTVDQSRTLRNFHDVHPDWAWAIVNETIAAPTPSWAYAVTVIDRCNNDGKPPSSLGKKRDVEYSAGGGSVQMLREVAAR